MHDQFPNFADPEQPFIIVLQKFSEEFHKILGFGLEAKKLTHDSSATEIV